MNTPYLDIRVADIQLEDDTEAGKISFFFSIDNKLSKVQHYDEGKKTAPKARLDLENDDSIIQIIVKNTSPHSNEILGSISFIASMFSMVPEQKIRQWITIFDDLDDDIFDGDMDIDDDEVPRILLEYTYNPNDSPVNLEVEEPVEEKLATFANQIDVQPSSKVDGSGRLVYDSTDSIDVSRDKTIPEASSFQEEPKRSRRSSVHEESANYELKHQPEGGDDDEESMDFSPQKRELFLARGSEDSGLESKQKDVSDSYSIKTDPDVSGLIEEREEVVTKTKNSQSMTVHSARTSQRVVEFEPEIAPDSFRTKAVEFETEEAKAKTETDQSLQGDADLDQTANDEGRDSSMLNDSIRDPRVNVQLKDAIGSLKAKRSSNSRSFENQDWPNDTSDSFSKSLVESLDNGDKYERPSGNRRETAFFPGSSSSALTGGREGGIEVNGPSSPFREPSSLSNAEELARLRGVERKLHQAERELEVIQHRERKLVHRVEEAEQQLQFERQEYDVQKKELENKVLALNTNITNMEIATQKKFDDILNECNVKLNSTDAQLIERKLAFETQGSMINELKEQVANANAQLQAEKQRMEAAFDLQKQRITQLEEQLQEKNNNLKETEQIKLEEEMKASKLAGDLSRLLATKEALTNNAQERDKDLVGLQQEVMELQKKLTESEHERAHQERKIDAFGPIEIENQELRSEIKKLRGELQDLQEKMKSESEEGEKGRQVLTKTECQIEELTEEMHKLSDERKEISEELYETKSKLSQEITEKETVTTKLTETKTELSEIYQKFDRQVELNETLTKQLIETEQLVTDLTKELNDLKRTLSVTGSELEVARRANEDHKESEENLRADVEHLKEELKEKERDLSDKKKQLEDMTESFVHAKSLSEQLKEENDSLHGDNERLKRLLEECRQQLIAAEGELRQQSQTIRSQSEEIQTLLEKTTTWKNEKEEESHRRKQLEREVSELEEVVSTTRKLLKETEIQRDEGVDGSEKMREEMADLRDELKRGQASREDLEEELKKIKEESERLRADAQDQKKEAQELSGEVSRLQKDIEYSKLATEEQIKRNGALAQENQESQKEMERVQEALNDAQKYKNDAEQTIQQLENTIQALKNELDVFEQRGDRELLEKAYEDLRLSENKKEQIQSDFEFKLGQLRTEFSKRHESSEGAFEEEKKKLAEALRGLQDQLTHKDGAIREMRERESSLKNDLQEVSRARDKLESVVEERDMLTEKVGNMKSLADKYHSDYVAVTHALAQKEKEVTDSKEELVRHKKKLDGKEMKINKLENQVQYLEDDIDRILEEHSKALQAQEKKFKVSKVDDLLVEFNKNAAIRFVKVGEGLYRFGTKKCFIKILNGRLVIRVGGGFMLLQEFLKLYTDAELARLTEQKRLENAGEKFSSISPTKHGKLLKAKTGVPQSGTTPREESPGKKRTQTPSRTRSGTGRDFENIPYNNIISGSLPANKDPSGKSVTVSFSKSDLAHESPLPRNKKRKSTGGSLRRVKSPNVSSHFDEENEDLNVSTPVNRSMKKFVSMDDGEDGEDNSMDYESGVMNRSASGRSPGYFAEVGAMNGTSVERTNKSFQAILKSKKKNLLQRTKSPSTGGGGGFIAPRDVSPGKGSRYQEGLSSGLPF